MRRIVITCWGSFGDVYPYIGLAKALKALGHDPVLAAPGYYRAAVEQEGLTFAAMSPDVDPHDRATMARVMDPVRGTQVVLQDLLIPALARSFEEVRRLASGADLLVSHPITLATPVVAEKMGLPWISTVLAPLSFFSVTDLPVFPPAPRLVHLRRLGPWVGKLFVGLARRSTRAWMEPVYRLRGEQGLPPGQHPLFEGQFSPAMTLAMFSRVLASPQPDWPPNVATTGFVFYNGPAASLDPALESFLDAGEPPIVFTLGTSAVGAAGRFYDESIKAVASLGRRAVLLTGGFRENQPASLPPGVLLVDRAPHQLLFPRASAIVHQGGIGTTAQALRSGKPMIVVPHGHDQPDNAFRVTNLGVARTVFPLQYRAARVARVLKELLEGDRHRRRSEEVATVVRQEGGAEAAAAEIDKLQVTRRSTADKRP